MNEELALAYLKEFHTPKHIIEHGKLVGKVAHLIASAYIVQGTQIDADVLYCACLMHDMFRIVDISDENFEKLKVNQSREDIEVWENLRREFQKKDHAVAAFEVLAGRGYEEVGLMIKKHGFEDMLGEDPPQTLEEKILTYADKRVLHTSIVPMATRFHDGHVRYHSKGMLSEREKQLHNAYYALEKELFDPIDLKPDEIADQL